MIFDKQNNTTLVSMETSSILVFLNKLNESYQKLENDNLIVNLFSFSKLSTNDLLEFLKLSNSHRATKKSFVIVTNKIEFDDIPEELIVVPTIKEAYDIIEMEEIERDLDF